jgi:hypothetical protein
MWYPFLRSVSYWFKDDCNKNEDWVALVGFFFSHYFFFFLYWWRIACPLVYNSYTTQVFGLLTEIIKRWNGYKSTSCSDHGGFRWAIFLPTIRRAQKYVHQRSRTVWKRYIENQGREAFQTSRIPGLYSYYTPMDKQYVISTIKIN